MATFAEFFRVLYTTELRNLIADLATATNIILAYIGQLFVLSEIQHHILLFEIRAIVYEFVHAVYCGEVEVRHHLNRMFCRVFFKTQDTTLLLCTICAHLICYEFRITAKPVKILDTIHANGMTIVL